VGRGPVASTHARFALSALFKWAIGEGLASVNPVTGTNRAAARSRDRVLTDAEIAAIWRACGDDDYGRIVRLLMLTGQRRDEVGGMRWAELSRQGWTIPAARTKNSREHIVPLAAAALALLPPERREFVFGDGPRRRGDPHRGFSGWSKGKAGLDARSGVTDWRLHDLRRTAATLMADRLGVLRIDDVGKQPCPRLQRPPYLSSVRGAVVCARHARTMAADMVQGCLARERRHLFEGQRLMTICGKINFCYRREPLIGREGVALA
jgi:integrase